MKWNIEGEAGTQYPPPVGGVRFGCVLERSDGEGQVPYRGN